MGIVDQAHYINKQFTRDSVNYLTILIFQSEMCNSNLSDLNK